MMKLCVRLAALPAITWGFTSSPQAFQNTNNVKAWSNYDQQLNNGFQAPISAQDASKNRLFGSTNLNMAFKLEEGQESNMFDGPMALTKERDACGVGFIANTKAGENDLIYLVDFMTLVFYCSSKSMVLNVKFRREIHLLVNCTDNLEWI